MLVLRQVSGLTDQPGFDPPTWPDLDVGALSDKDRKDYETRKLAVTLYFEGVAASEIRERCGLGIRQVNRIIRERCSPMNPDGRMNGWRLLVKHRRKGGYSRIQPVRADAFGFGTAGALGSVLEREPDLAERFNKHILKYTTSGKLGQTAKPIHAIWSWFLKELRGLHYEVRNEWPFTVKSMGYSAVRSYAKRLLAANPSIAARQQGPETTAKLKAGDGVDRPVLKVFERVEMDAHKIDGRFCVLFAQQDGDWTPKIVHRIWVIVLIEIVSRAVIGYLLSVNREVTANDTLRAIKSALTRWKRRELHLGDTTYDEEASLPSGHDERYVGLRWDQTCVDGALAETCKTVKEKLEGVAHSALLTPSEGYLSRRSKDDRPFIEAFFRTLGARGFQRLTNTTGSKPSAKFGRRPDEVAVASQFQWQYAEELLDVLIANYNATPHSSLGHRSPLAVLDFLTRQPGAQLKYASPEAVRQLLSYRKPCSVKGGVKEGRLPYVNFENAKYTSDTLQHQVNLLGSKIWVVNHIEDDARVALASTMDGVELGVLRAAPPWHRLPHSLAVRKQISSLITNRRFVLSGGDAITSFCDFVESQKGRKLPVHPAYLELQRILSQQGVQVSVEDDLARAKEHLDEAHQMAKSLIDRPSPELVSTEQPPKVNARQVASPVRADGLDVSRTAASDERPVVPGNRRKVLPILRKVAD